MSTATASTKMLSPPAVARQLGVKAEKIIRWIRAGELRAADVSTQAGIGRPRFRIDPADLAVFLNGRAVVAIPKPRRRRRVDLGVIEFF